MSTSSEEHGDVADFLAELDDVECASLDGEQTALSWPLRNLPLTTPPPAPLPSQDEIPPILLPSENESPGAVASGCPRIPLPAGHGHAEQDEGAPAAQEGLDSAAAGVAWARTTACVRRSDAPTAVLEAYQADVPEWAGIAAQSVLWEAILRPRAAGGAGSRGYVCQILKQVVGACDRGRLEVSDVLLQSLLRLQSARASDAAAAELRDLGRLTEAERGGGGSGGSGGEQRRDDSHAAAAAAAATTVQQSLPEEEAASMGSWHGSQPQDVDINMRWRERVLGDM
jgi:hypothetical protein